MKRRIPLFPLTAFAVFFFFLSWYVLVGLETIAHQPLVPIVFWSISLLSLGALYYALQGMRSRGMGQFFKVSTHFFLVLFVSEVIFALLIFAGDIYRGLYGLVNFGLKGDFLSPGRSQYWIGLGASLFLVTILLFIYGMLRGKYAYRVVRHSLYFENLPAAFDGFTITQISDVHAGSFTNPKAVQRGIELIKEQDSDVFVFTGDLVNNKAEEIEPWIGHFSQIKARYGQFSVLGNHDYGDYVAWPDEGTKRANLQQLKHYHDALGFKLLLDENVTLRKDGEQIFLAGIENWGLGFGERGDLEKALNGTKTDDFKVLLSHDPSHWEAQVKNHQSNIDLTLSGHTHGMQFGIEAFGIKWSPVKYRYAHWAGIKHENNRFLNVNRGFGFIGFSGRVGIWPEITVIQLKKARS